jgi:hypothetical protein
MFRALLPHPLEAPPQAAPGILRVYYVSWLHQDGNGTSILVQPTNIPRMQNTKYRLWKTS